MARRRNDRGPEPIAFLTHKDADGCEICLKIGTDEWLFTKTEATHLAAKLAMVAGAPATIGVKTDGDGKKEPCLVWDDTSLFAQTLFNLYNPYGDFS